MRQRKHSATNIYSRIYSRPLRFELLEGRVMLARHGDFNGDGRDDLAISILSEDVGGIVNAGAVSVVYGSRKGLTAIGNQTWHQNVAGVEGTATVNDMFGNALAAGDFNGDGFDDLAIAVSRKKVGSQSQAGAVNVLYGSASGLRATGDQLWTQDSSGINDSAEGGDRFGSALVAGDFNGDGRDDLAVGVSGEDVGVIADAGAVNAIYGSASGLTGAGDQFWSQNSSGINDSAEEDDDFGYALAAGDFNGDSRDDLAIGVPNEAVGSLALAGAVNVIYGSQSGLTSSGDQFWTQDSDGVVDDAEILDQFGSILAAGDFNGDGSDDLAIGVPGEALGAIGSAGRVNVIYGSASKLTALGNAQFAASVLGFSLQENAKFGLALTAGDFNGDGDDDLAIGAPFEEVDTAAGAGAVYVAYGSASGLAPTGAQRWVQGGALAEFSEGEDNVGQSILAGDFNGDGHFDLAIGVPGESLGAHITHTGMVHILYGFFASGLFDVGTTVFHQDLLISSDGNEADDVFGSALG